MDILQVIKERKSIRSFLDKPVDSHLIHTILDTARYAPSGVNTQPWFVVAVSNSYIQKIGDSIKAARDSNIPENPDYHYYPKNWPEPYKSRRKACGAALYSSINITKEQTEARDIQWNKNYYFFGAPVGLLFFVDNELEKGSWMDMGMFIQNVMLAARTLGLETCAQASLAEFPDIIRKIVDVPNHYALACGMALGYANFADPINQYRTTREPVESFTKFLGFSQP